MNELAIHGGKPLREKMLPYARQTIDEVDCLSVINALNSDFLTTGPVIREFENRLCEITGAKFAVAFSNGTAALHGACYACGLSAGDEGITSPITFAASANCMLYMGARPVFADIDEETFNIDTNEIEKKITANTKVIIPVDYTGQAADIDAVNELAKTRDITVIEDAAHSLGTKYKSRPVGSLTDMTEFSFHPVKTATTGEGGAITTDDEKLYQKLMRFRAHGIVQSGREGPWFYEQTELGYNYRITDIQCALGISQLTKLDSFAARRDELKKKYNETFSEMKGLILQKNAPYSETVNHLYVIRLDLAAFKTGRREIFEALRAENIGVHVHYIPVYYHPYYQSLGYKKGICPKAEAVYDSLITVPFFPSMSDKDAQDVLDGFDKVLKHYLK